MLIEREPGLKDIADSWWLTRSLFHV